MIPSPLATQLESGLRSYLRSSLWSPTPDLAGVADRLLADREATWKGPWVDVRLPFVAGTNAAAFPDLPLPFTPHAHQERAFERLGGRRKRSTLVATGTGSGKTEAFLLPVLAHCLEAAARPGVKAILIYPMNALATDQAIRLARLVHGQPRLRGVVRAGLYVGDDSGGKARATATMGADHLITDRDALRDEPPDILLTNYKMLDYLLLRPSDQGLWRHNARGVLRFVVVDELHTFDGAQGTDLACLLRRLKRRLEADDGALCCVGTSATLGGEGSGDRLRAYAREIFGEPFDDDAIVGEQRVDAATFLAGAGPDLSDEPKPDDRDALDPDLAASPEAWIFAQAALWLGDAAPAPPARTPPPTAPPTAADDAATGRWATALGRALRRHAVVGHLLRELDGPPRPLRDLVGELARGRSAWRDDPDFGRACVLSLVGLLSAARRPAQGAPDDGSGRVVPFIDVRLQAWQRELARLVASVGPQPAIAYSDDLEGSDRRRFLPLIRCSDCGALAWGSRHDRDDTRSLSCDPQSFYRAWFGKDPTVRLLVPAQAVPPGAPAFRGAAELRVHPASLRRVHPGEEGYDDAYALRELPTLRTVQREGVPTQETSQDCPFCQGRDRLLIAGFRTATLASVAVDQLFSSRYNDDKRLLAFSDSVQDAAHRAGFLGARTWQTNVRIATTQALPDDGAPVPLDALPDRVLATWRDGGRLEPGAFLATFVPPDLQWRHEWDDLVSTGRAPATGGLAELVERRLRWEILGEASLWAGRGRSLERVGAAAVAVAPAILDAACAASLTPLRERVPGLRKLDEATLRRFLLGFLHGLRLRGGVVHAGIPEGFLASGGNRFTLTGVRHLPDITPRTRLPVLMCDSRDTDGFDDVRAPGSWMQRWTGRALSPEALGPTWVDVWDALAPALVAAGALVERTGVVRGASFTAWGVPAQALQVSRACAPLACDKCGSRNTIAQAALPAWRGVPCLAAGCAGQLQPVERPTDYFAKLYATGDLQRVHAEEHTGLLDRARRESVERRFKAPDPPPGWQPAESDDPDAHPFRRPWDPNLLSCTPTLEMGIDVGDLSSTLLCSVPPSQASYLQRIGRAGRRDGNALLLTIASARPHDRWFWEQPEEMLAGEIAPPGLFLDATAVLERHLAAFCLDRWIAHAGEAAELPTMLGRVLDAVKIRDTRLFPYPFLEFVDAHEARLHGEFAEMFRQWASPGTLESLRGFLHGRSDEGSLGFRLLALFESEHKQVEALRADARRLAAEIKALQALPVAPTDLAETVAELQREKEGLQRLATAARARHLLEFLTDYGALPNYAFPEAAARLRTVIFRKKADKRDDAERGYESWSYEYVRAPANALGEFAPGSTFYAGGYQVKIDRVDLASQGVESWRFCPSCNHSERVDERDEHLRCPACDDPTWPDPAQRQRLLRLTQVFASTSARRGRIRDDSDERRPQIHSRQMLVGVSDANRKCAFMLDPDKAVFAFEFIERARFSDVNFGEPTNDGAKSLIAGSERVRGGFRVCRECGTVQPRRGKARHTKFCPSQKKAREPQIEECLYLYRTFRSEAIRVLLPVADVGDSQRVDSFVAALKLGLRERFGGQLGHLATIVVSEPAEETTLRKQLLVLYDTVPGGTGYLDELVRPHPATGRLPLFEVLELALKKIQACRCKSTQKDGCYRCLLGYHNSASIGGIRASVAEEMLGALLVHEPTLRAIPSIDGVSVHGMLDSALEARFLEALRRVEVAGKPVIVEPAIHGTRTGYRLRAGARTWNVLPQVTYGRAEGLEIGVSADFVLTPEGRSTDGAARKPIAVFLDGWRYHNAQTGHDLMQRQLLAEGGRVGTWTLTWRDLDEILVRDATPPASALPLTHEIVQRAAAAAKAPHLAHLLDRPLLQVLADELAADADAGWTTFAGTLVAAALATRPSVSWADAVDGLLPPALAGVASEPVARAARLSEVEGVQIAAGVTPDRRIVAVLHLDDAWEEDTPAARDRWRAALRAFQLLSPLPDLWAVASTSTPADVVHLARRREATPRRRDAQPRHAAEGWVDRAASSDLLAGDEVTLARALADAGVPVPEIGYDVVVGTRVVAEAVLAWPDRRVAVLDAACGPVVAEGWTLFSFEAARVIAPVTAALSAGGRA